MFGGGNMRYLQNEVNLHTHSFYCMHGEGKISEYVKKADEESRIKILLGAECDWIKDEKGF